MFLLNEDTICAPATVPGTGAISVIRVSGPEALVAVSAIVHCPGGKSVASAPGYSVCFGKVFKEDGSLLDEVLVSVFRAPHSYTGEDSAEISCHASGYIVDNILLLLIEHGLRAASPGEFTRRAFLNGKMDLAQAEAVADLIAAENAAAHRVALDQMKGVFSSELKKMRDKLLNIVSLMELELDFSEEDVEFADRSELLELVDEVSARVGSLISSFRLGNAIRNGIPVAIAGATNTGKSTLLNALAGEERAIVSDVHGTTRDTIEETMNVDGLLFRFIDTAGLRTTDETVEKIGIERTFRKLSEAVVIIVMTDVTRPVQETEDCLSDILGRVDPSRQKVVFALNKADLLEEKACHTAPDTSSSDIYASDTLASYISASDIFVPDTSVPELSVSDRSVHDFSAHDHSAPDHSGQRSATAVFPGSPASVQSIGNGCGIPGDMPGVSGRPDSQDAGLIGKIVSIINAACSRYGVITFSTVLLSAKSGDGVDSLRHTLVSLCPEYSTASDNVIVTNLRHIEALRSASDSLSRVRDGIASRIPTDLVSQDIREALYHLGEILGEISTDEVLGSVFSRFCVGK